MVMNAIVQYNDWLEEEVNIYSLIAFGSWYSGSSW